MEKGKITFKDGTEMSLLEINANSFYTGENPTFPDDLSEVIVEGKDTADEDVHFEYHNARVIECAPIDGKYWFTFGEISAQEQMRADLDYIMIMEDL